MLRKLDSLSVGVGMGVAIAVACVMGAAANHLPADRHIDASNVMGGLGLQIVDHRVNKLYNYKREKLDDESAIYVLYETVDLSKAGIGRLPVKVHVKD